MSSDICTHVYTCRYLATVHLAPRSQAVRTTAITHTEAAHHMASHYVHEDTCVYHPNCIRWDSVPNMVEGDVQYMSGSFLSSYMPGFLLEGGARGGICPPLKVLPPLSQIDLPHIQPHVFSCYPPRFSYMRFAPPCHFFLK